MKLFPSKPSVVLMTILSSSAPAMAAGDAAAGQSVFAARCAACHATEAGQNKIGPSLAGIVGSKSGTIPGFNFSSGMKNADVTTTPTSTSFSRTPSGSSTAPKCSSIFQAKSIGRT